MFCDRCGANLQGAGNFCPHCGREFAAPPQLPAVNRVNDHLRNLANPCVAPWTDYTPPVQYLWWFGVGNNPPTMNTVLANPSVTATTAMLWLNTFKPNVTLTVYYGTAAPGACDLNNPQPPNCMQPFPNSGFQAMLAAVGYLDCRPPE